MTTTKTATLSDGAIRDLRDRARRRDDHNTAALCTIALGEAAIGDQAQARREVSKIIASGGLPPIPRPPNIDRTPIETDPVTGVDARAIEPWHALPGAAARTATIRWHATADHPAVTCQIRVYRNELGRPVIEIDARDVDIKLVTEAV